MAQVSRGIISSIYNATIGDALFMLGVPKDGWEQRVRRETGKENPTADEIAVSENICRENLMREKDMGSSPELALWMIVHDHKPS